MKDTYDIVNAIFELAAGLFLTLNVIEIVRVKNISGVHIAPAVFFSVWGVWNIFYYPTLNQKWSFYTAILVLLVNTIWVILAIIYSRRHKRRCIVAGPLPKRG